MRMAELLADAGLPKGVFSIVHGSQVVAKARMLVMFPRSLPKGAWATQSGPQQASNSHR